MAHRALDEALADAARGQEELEACKESLLSLATQLDAHRAAARDAGDAAQRGASDHRRLQDRLQRLHTCPPLSPPQPPAQLT